MKVVEPALITDSNIVDLNIVETNFSYDSFSTYTLGFHVYVEGTLGERLIYKSLQAGNIGNTPSSSPTWWEYVSKTYSPFVQGLQFGNGSYPLGYTVLDTSTGGVYESLTVDNANVLDPSTTIPWVEVGTNNSTLPADFLFGTTYAVDALVYFTESTIGGSFGQTNTMIQQGVYKSLQNANTGNVPLPFTTGDVWWELQTNFPVPWVDEIYYVANSVVYDTTGKLWQTPYGVRAIEPVSSYSTTWLKIGVNNRTAMFDNQSSTTSVANSKISMTLKTGIIDTVGLINLNAAGVTITVRDSLGGNIMYTQTVDLVTDLPQNAWDYYFGELDNLLTQYVFTDLPPLTDGHVTIEITGGSSTSIGNLIVGRSKDLGISIYGAQAGILDFSTKNTDSFANTTFVQRGYKKTLTIQTEVEKLKVNTVQRKLYNIRATPCLWISTTDVDLSEPLVIYGFYKDFSTDISYPTHSLCSLEIEGLT